MDESFISLPGNREIGIVLALRNFIMISGSCLDGSYRLTDNLYIFSWNSSQLICDSFTYSRINSKLNGYIYIYTIKINKCFRYSLLHRKTFVS